MPTQVHKDAAQQERETHARRWLQFRKDNLLSQRRFAEMIGLARRTIQLIEGSKVIPLISTQARFRDFVRDYSAKYGGGKAA